MKKILILEDVPDIADIVEMALSGNYVTLVKRSDKGLHEEIHSFKPDVMLIDNLVGQTQASAIISRIRSVQNDKTIPFVLFSGHSDIKLLAQQLGATGYLPKPFSLNQLRQCIEEALSLQLE